MNMEGMVQVIKEIFGYDEASNLIEMDEAEQAWEKIKTDNPDEAASIQKETDEGFKKLMNQIRAKKIKPVTEKEYLKRQMRENRW